MLGIFVYCNVLSHDAIYMWRVNLRIFRNAKDLYFVSHLYNYKGKSSDRLRVIKDFPRDKTRHTRLLSPVKLDCCLAATRGTRYM